MTISNTWFLGVSDPERKKDIRIKFPESLFIRRRLKEICELKISTAEKDSVSKEGYDCPNWAMKQADLMGYKRALHDIIKILGADQQPKE